MGYETAYTVSDEVRILRYGGKIGVIDRVIYETVNGQETNIIYAYEVTIDGEGGYIIYPHEIA